MNIEKQKSQNVSVSGYQANVVNAEHISAYTANRFRVGKGIISNICATSTQNLQKGNIAIV